MISIHLRRTGAKKDPHYRVVVTDSRAARDGAFVEILGHYHPRFEPAKVTLDVAKTKAWIEKGAQPSDTVRSLLRKVENYAQRKGFRHLEMELPPEEKDIIAFLFSQGFHVVHRSAGTRRRAERRRARARARRRRGRRWAHRGARRWAG